MIIGGYYLDHILYLEGPGSSLGNSQVKSAKTKPSKCVTFKVMLVSCGWREAKKEGTFDLELVLEVTQHGGGKTLGHKTSFRKVLDIIKT